MAETQFSSSEKEQVDEWTVETVEVRSCVLQVKLQSLFPLTRNSWEVLVLHPFSPNIYKNTYILSRLGLTTHSSITYLAQEHLK